jgi:deoxyribonuclease V
VHPRPTSVAEARAIQDRLRPLVRRDGEPFEPRTVAGLDVSYAVGSDRLAAAAVVLDAFDYVPGLLAFREIPALVTALERLAVVPDLLVCDGYGVAHPRRFGLACHLGVLTDLPTIGVAKTPFTGAYSPPGERRGAWSPLLEDGYRLPETTRHADHLSRRRLSEIQDG